MRISLLALTAWFLAAPTFAQPVATERPAPCLTETTARALAHAEPTTPEHRTLQNSLTRRPATHPDRQRPDRRAARPAELTPCADARLRTDDARPRRARPLARDADEGPSEVVYEYWDGDWYPDARDLYTYDGAGRVVEEIFQYWGMPWEDARAQADWQDAYRTRYAYDGAGRLVEVLEAWYFEGWAEDWRATLTYDAAGRLDRILFAEIWDETWWDYGRQLYTYEGAAPNPSVVLLQYVDWDDLAPRGDAEWVNAYRNVYTYTSGRLASETAQGWDLFASDWVNFWRDLYTYDASGYLIEFLWQFDNEGSWLNDARILYTNNAIGQFTAALLQQWAFDDDARGDGYWEDALRAFVAYNTAGNWVQIVVEYWDGSAWQNDERALFAYDNAGTRLIEERWQYWWAGTWRDSFRARFLYGTTSAEPGAAPLALSLSAAPNPARGALTVHYDLAAPARVRVAVYDALGRRVAAPADADAPAGTGAVALDVSGLAPGVYVLRVEAGSEVATRRVTVVR